MGHVCAVRASLLSLGMGEYTVQISAPRALTAPHRLTSPHKGTRGQAARKSRGNLSAPARPAVPSLSFRSLLRDFPLFFEETRPSVQFVFFMRLLAGAVISAGGLSAFGPPTAGAAAAWVLATLFTYGINGVCDVREDQVNKTGRPIARGALPARMAAVWTWLCAAASVALALLTGSTLLTAYDLVFLFLGYAYSAAPFQLKRSSAGTSGSVLLMGLLTYAAGWTAVGRTLPSAPGVAVAIAMSLWMAAVGAITKDFSHVTGDAAVGRRTSVTAWGDGAARLAGAAGALLVAAGFAAVALHRRALLGPAAAVLAVGAVTVAVLCTTTRGDAARGRTPYRAFMVTQYLVHLALFATLAWTAR
jgi:4-hydroxybenzoate polyprenyltransferase